MEMIRPKILIVDDESSIRTALQRWFTIRGFDVDQAADGVEAVDKCQEQCYDIVTMDLEMPRMNGLEAIVALRKFRPEVPIVVLTGYMREGQSAMSYGATKVMTKPVRLVDLETQIRELLPTPA